MSDDKFKDGLSICRLSAGAKPGHLTSRAEIIQATSALILHSILMELREIKEALSHDAGS